MVHIGNDILRIERIKDTIEKQGDTFLKRIFSEDEIKYCESKNISKYQSYAARFCAKEAVYKALSQNFPKNFDWKDIEVRKMESGKPFISFNNSLDDLTKVLESHDLSLSHEGEYAIADFVCSIKEER